MSHHCGGQAKGKARFAIGAWDDDYPKSVFSDAKAVIVCRTDAPFDCGTHTIFVGLAEQVRVMATWIR